MLKIETQKSLNIDPYLRALDFFKKVPEISTKFKEQYKKYNQKQNNSLQDKSFEDFIELFKNTDICINEDDNDEAINDKNSYYQKPEKIFNYFLDQLHMIFRNNTENIERKTASLETDQKVAIQLFEEFDNKNDSYIKNSFFGKKIIIKRCTKCSMTYYYYNYLKTISLNIKDSNIDYHLVTCLRNIERNFDEEFFCPMCSSKQMFNMSIKILEKPQYLIIIITGHNNKKMKVPLYIYENSYKLIAAEVKNVKNKSPNLLNYIFKMCSKSHYELLFSDINGYNDLIDVDDLLQGTPFVLFYRKVQKDNKEKNYKEYECSKDIFIKNLDEEGKNSDDNMCFSNSNNKINNNNYNNKNDYDCFIMPKQINEICLYFRFERNDKEIYIDIDDSLTFKDIVEKIMNKYQYQYSIDENNLYYKDKKINCNKSPKQLGIENESRIIIK